MTILEIVLAAGGVIGLLWLLIAWKDKRDAERYAVQRYIREKAPHLCAALDSYGHDRPVTSGGGFGAGVANRERHFDCAEIGRAHV